MTIGREGKRQGLESLHFILGGGPISHSCLYIPFDTVRIYHDKECDERQRTNSKGQWVH